MRFIKADIKNDWIVYFFFFCVTISIAQYEHWTIKKCVLNCSCQISIKNRWISSYLLASLLPQIHQFVFFFLAVFSCSGESSTAFLDLLFDVNFPLIFFFRENVPIFFMNSSPKLPFGLKLFHIKTLDFNWKHISIHFLFWHKICFTRSWLCCINNINDKFILKSVYFHTVVKIYLSIEIQILFFRIVRCKSEAFKWIVMRQLEHHWCS